MFYHLPEVFYMADRHDHFSVWNLGFVLEKPIMDKQGEISLCPIASVTFNW